jgi:hypothetical protein
LAQRPARASGGAVFGNEVLDAMPVHRAGRPRRRRARARRLAGGYRANWSGRTGRRRPTPWQARRLCAGCASPAAWPRVRLPGRARCAHARRPSSPASPDVSARAC